jgi:type IV secretion system protein VirD4
MGRVLVVVREAFQSPGVLDYRAHGGQRGLRQARWGRDGAGMLWGSATLKLILGGLAGDDLREISDLAGEYRETVISWQRGHGGYTISSSLQDRKTIRRDEVRTLSALEREALVIHATTRPVKARLTRHYESAHRREFAASGQCGRLSDR